MPRLTKEQKDLIAELKGTKTPTQISKAMGIDHQLVNYYYSKNKWERLKERHWLNEEEKKFILENTGFLSYSKISIRLWGKTSDTTRSRISCFLKHEGIKESKLKDKVKIDASVVEMVRQAAQRYKKTA